MKPPVVRRFTVRRLWQLCEDRVFAVPEIQREFVWDKKRIGNLLDSIHRGLPIGSLLIWETNSKYRHELREAQHVLPPYNTANKRIWFILDGQQRLSVLYRARYGHSIETSYGDLFDFNKLCLSFDGRVDSRFLFLRRQAGKLHAPLPDLLCSSWRRKLARLSNGRVLEAEKVRERIANYQIPVMIVRTSKLDEVREAFLRINSGGLRVSKADRAFSRASRLNLRHLINGLRSNLPKGFDQVDNRVLQAAMAVIVGQKDISSAAIDSAIRKLEVEGIENGKVTQGFARRWKDIESAIGKAVDYLCTELGVPNFSFLPSDNMIAVLAYFFHENNLSQPNSRQRRELRKWFWSTGVNRRYVGRGYYQNIRQDIDFFSRLGRRRTGLFHVNTLIPRSDVRSTDFQAGGSLVTTYFLMLLHRNPCYLGSGNHIPTDATASPSNRKDKHHIFPKALLIRNGLSPREANSLSNVCYVVAEENQAFGSNKPINYLDPFRQKKHFVSVMKRHLIPYKGDSGLWLRDPRKGFRRFAKQRLELICAALEREAGIKLFQKDE